MKEPVPPRPAGPTDTSASERHGRFPLPNFSSDGSAEEAAEEAGAVTEQPARVSERSHSGGSDSSGSDQDRDRPRLWLGNLGGQSVSVVDMDLAATLPRRHTVPKVSYRTQLATPQSPAPYLPAGSHALVLPCSAVGLAWPCAE